MLYGIMTDYQYNDTHKRERLSLWSGAFASDWEGEAYSLPKGDGYMVTLHSGRKVRVSCPVGRSGENYRTIDAAINAAINEEEN